MSEVILILDEKELSVRVEAKTLRIEGPNRKMRRVPLQMINSVIIIGRPSVTCDVWRSLAAFSIPAVLLPARGNGPVAYLGTGLSRNAYTRINQHKAYQDSARTNAIARWLISEKLSQQIQMLERLSKEKTDATNKYCRKISKYRAQLGDMDKRERIMGIEGVAAAGYFKAIRKIIPGKWKFNKRNRRPPKDPVNAVLSLTYAMYEGLVRNAIQKKGLDPAIGFLHAFQPNRDGFVLDAMELVRAAADQFSLYMIAHKLSPRDFTKNGNDGCLLQKQGRKEYFQQWAIYQRQGLKDQNPPELVVKNAIEMFLQQLPA